MSGLFPLSAVNKQDKESDVCSTLNAALWASVLYNSCSYLKQQLKNYEKISYCFVIVLCFTIWLNWAAPSLNWFYNDLQSNNLCIVGTLAVKVISEPHGKLFVLNIKLFKSIFHTTSRWREGGNRPNREQSRNTTKRVRERKVTSSYCNNKM